MIETDDEYATGRRHGSCSFAEFLERAAEHITTLKVRRVKTRARETNGVNQNSAVWKWAASVGVDFPSMLLDVASMTDNSRILSITIECSSLD